MICLQEEEEEEEEEEEYLQISLQWTGCIVLFSSAWTNLVLSGHDHAQSVSAQGVVQAAGDRASRFRANGRRHGRTGALDRDAAAGEEST